MTADKKECRNCGHMMRYHIFARFECSVEGCDCQRVDIKGLLP